MSNLQFNYSGLLKKSIGTSGLLETDLKKLEGRLKTANAKFAKDANSDYMAFNRLMDESKEVLAIKYLADKLKNQFENLIVVGIGGSDLGARAIIGALASQYHNEMPKEKRKGMKIYFCGDTTDPKPLRELLEAVDLKKSAIHVISKSGTTIETMSAFAILRERLISLVGKEAHIKHIIATTDPKSGALNSIVIKNNYALLPHGPVGGRFSALSSVGLLAVACAGINIDKLIAGASEQRKTISEKTLKNNPSFAYAATQYLLAKKKKNISVLIPYSYKLKTFGAWYRQLWAESLGKDGQGQTPIAALGPTDQHSQLQLYQDGPNDKVFTFIEAGSKDALSIPTLDEPTIKYFDNHPLSQVLNYELTATKQALQEHQRPTCLISLPELNEVTLGSLIYFFELATAYSGELYKINAFDQPGVELSKKYLHKMLGKK